MEQSSPDEPESPRSLEPGQPPQTFIRKDKFRRSFDKLSYRRLQRTNSASYSKNNISDLKRLFEKSANDERANADLINEQTTAIPKKTRDNELITSAQDNRVLNENVDSEVQIHNIKRDNYFKRNKVNINDTTKRIGESLNQPFASIENNEIKRLDSIKTKSDEPKREIKKFEESKQSISSATVIKNQFSNISTNEIKPRSIISLEEKIGEGTIREPKKIKPAIPVRYNRGTKRIEHKEDERNYKGPEYIGTKYYLENNKDLGSRPKESAKFQQGKDKKSEDSKQEKSIQLDKTGWEIKEVFVSKKHIEEEEKVIFTKSEQINPKQNEESESYQLRTKPIIEVKPLKNEEIAQRVSNIEKLQSSLRKSVFEDTPTLLRKSLTKTANVIEDSPTLPSRTSYEVSELNKDNNLSLQSSSDSNYNSKNTNLETLKQEKQDSETKNTTSKTDLTENKDQRAILPPRNSSGKSLEDLVLLVRNRSISTEENQIVLRKNTSKETFATSDKNITNQANTSATHINKNRKASENTSEESVVLRKKLSSVPCSSQTERLTENKTSSEDTQVVSNRNYNEKPSKLPLPSRKAHTNEATSSLQYKFSPQVKSSSENTSGEGPPNIAKKNAATENNSVLLNKTLNEINSENNSGKRLVLPQSSTRNVSSDLIVENITYEGPPIVLHESPQDITVQDNKSNRDDKTSERSILILKNNSDKLSSVEDPTTDKRIRSTEETNQPENKEVGESTEESPVILRKNSRKNSSDKKRTSSKRVSFSPDIEKFPIPTPRKFTVPKEPKTPVEVVTVEVKTVYKESVTPVLLSEDSKKDVNSNYQNNENLIINSDHSKVINEDFDNLKVQKNDQITPENAKYYLGTYQDSVCVRKTKEDKERFLNRTNEVSSNLQSLNEETILKRVETDSNSEDNLRKPDSKRNSRTVFNILSQNNEHLASEKRSNLKRNSAPEQLSSKSKSTGSLHKTQSKKFSRRSNPLDLKSKSAIISKPRVSNAQDIQLADVEDRYILARQSSEDSIDKIQLALDQFIMDDKKEKKRTNSFKKIFKNFSRKDKDKKKPKKVENEVVEDNAQNESVNRNSILGGQTMKNPTTDGIPQLRRNKELPEIPTEEVEKRYAQMHINRYNQVRANFEQTDPTKFSEDYVCMDNGNKYSYINTAEVNKYIDTSSSSNTLDSENLAFRDSDNSSGLEVKNEAFFETPPRAFDTYQNVQLVKPKANIPINSERPLPLPYQNNSFYGSKHEPEAENANNKNEFSDGVYGTVYDRKLIKTSPDVSISDRSLRSRSPSLEGSKLKMPINREKVELQPRIRSPIPPSEVSTDKIIATELLKNKKDKRSSPSHQRLEIEIDYPDAGINRLVAVQQDGNPKGKPPISPQSKILQNLEAGEWHKRQKEMNVAPSLEAMELQRKQRDGVSPNAEDWAFRQRNGDEDWQRKQREQMSSNAEEWQRKQRERMSPSVEEWQKKQRERMSPTVDFQNKQTNQMSPSIEDSQKKQREGVPISEDVWRRQRDAKSPPVEDYIRQKGAISPSFEDWQRQKRDGMSLEKKQQHESSLPLESWQRKHKQDDWQQKGTTSEQGVWQKVNRAEVSPKLEEWKGKSSEISARDGENWQIRQNQEGFTRINKRSSNQETSPKMQKDFAQIDTPTSSIYEEGRRKERNTSLSPTFELKQRQATMSPTVEEWRRQQKEILASEQRKQISPTPDDWQRREHLANNRSNYNSLDLVEYQKTIVGKQMNLSPKSSHSVMGTPSNQANLNQQKINNLAEWQKIHSKQKEPSAIDIVEWRSKIARSPPVEQMNSSRGLPAEGSKVTSIYSTSSQNVPEDKSNYTRRMPSEAQDRQVRSPPVEQADYMRKAPLHYSSQHTPVDQTDYVRRQLVEGSKSVPTDHQKRYPPSEGNSSIYSSNYGSNSNTQLTTNVLVHVDSHSPQNRSVTPVSRSTTPVTLRSPSNISLQRTPPKHEIRQSVEAFCWKELKKMKEQEDIQMQIQLSNYGYLEDPIISHRSRSMSPNHARNTRRSSSLPREVQRQRRLEDAGIAGRTRAEPIYGQRVVYNPSFVRNSPQRNTIGTSTVTNNGQKPIFKRGSLSQNYNTDLQALNYKKVGFHSPQNPENPQAWPTKNGYTQSPPQRRLEIKREVSLEDEVFMPDKSKEPIYGGNSSGPIYSKTKEPTREEIFLMNQERQRQMREMKEPIYDFRPLPNEQFYRQNGQYRNPEREPIYGIRQQIREPIYGCRVMPNISEEGMYAQKPYSHNARTSKPNLQRNNSFTQRYDYPPNEVRGQEPIYTRNPQEIYGHLGQKVTTVNNKVCDIYGKIHDGQVQKSGVLYGQLQRNTNVPPTQYQSYNQIQNQNFVRGTRLTASVNDMNRYYHQDPRFRSQQQQQQQQQHHEPPDRPLPPIPNDKKFRKQPNNSDTESEVQRIFQTKNRIAGK